MRFRPPYRPAGDRVFQAIKARLIAYEFPPGERIYLEPIAESLGVSTTPVREAMNRLAERDLVIKAENKGFYAMTLTEERVRGYYELTRSLLVIGLEASPPSVEHSMRHDPATAQILTRLNRREIADVTVLARYAGEVFNAIAAVTGNEATRHAVEMANDHLFFVRTIECRHIPLIQTELRGLCEFILSGQRGELIAGVNDYYRKRLAIVPELFVE